MAQMDRLQLERLQRQALEDEAIEPDEVFLDAVPGYYSRYAVGGVQQSITQVSATLAYSDRRIVFVGPEHTISCDFAVIDELDLQQEDTFVAAGWEADAGTVEVDWRSERGQKIDVFFEAMMVVCNTRREEDESEQAEAVASIEIPADAHELTDIVCLSALESDTMEFEQFAVAFKTGPDTYLVTGSDDVHTWSDLYSYGVQTAQDKGGELMLTVMDPRDDW